MDSFANNPTSTSPPTTSPPSNAAAGNCNSMAAAIKEDLARCAAKLEALDCLLQKVTSNAPTTANKDGFEPPRNPPLIKPCEIISSLIRIHTTTGTILKDLTSQYKKQ